MKYTELRDDIKKNGIGGVYLLEGEDAYFRGNAEKALKGPCLQMPELDFSSYEGASLKSADSFSDLVTAVNNFPFGSEKRVVRICEFYPTEETYGKYLKDTFENMPSSALVIINNSQDRKNILRKKKCVKFVDCSHAGEEDVAKWVYVTLRSGGVKCSSEAAYAVAQYCLCDMSRVSAETQKLLYSSKSEIGLRDVDESVYKDADYRIYEMTRALADKNYSLFCEIAQDLQTKGMEKGAVISSILSYFKTLHSVITAAGSNAEVADMLNMKEYSVKKDREQARRIGRERLERYIKVLYGYLSDARGGLMSADGAYDCAVAEIFFGGQ